MPSLLYLDNDYVLRMAGMPQVIAEFPTLAGLLNRLKEQARAAPSCGSCGKPAAKTADTVDFGTIRAAIAGLPAERKLRLRALLGARQVRVFYIDSTGKHRTDVF